LGSLGKVNKKIYGFIIAIVVSVMAGIIAQYALPVTSSFLGLIPVIGDWFLPPPVVDNQYVDLNDISSSSRIELSAKTNDPNEKFTFHITSKPLHGQLDATKKDSGVFYYSPDPGFFRSDSFKFKVEGKKFSKEAFVNIKLNPYRIVDTISINEKIPNIPTVLKMEKETSEFPYTVGTYSIAVDSIGRLFISNYDFGWIIYSDSNNNNFKYLVRPVQSIQPIDIAFDKSNKLYVADVDNSEIIKTDPDNYFPEVFVELENPPTSIAIDQNESNVYVTLSIDDSTSEIQKFDANGNIQDITTIGSILSGIAIDENQNVYVTDYDNHIVRKFDRNLHELFSWGGWGHDAGQFSGPSDIIVDNRNSLIVADPGSNRMAKFDTNGTLLFEWDALWVGLFHEFNPWPGPLRLASETNNEYIYTFDSRGEYLNIYYPNF
jgi:DNA-binding beta-propeller fold protein YncE